jgi:hypothetical protein
MNGPWRRGGRLATMLSMSLALVLAPVGSALAGVPQAPGGTIYFYRSTVPAGPYAVAPDGTALGALSCAGDRTHEAGARRVVRVEPVGGTFVRFGWQGLIEEPVVRLVSTDDSCGDVQVLWEPGPGFVLTAPMWSLDGTRVALDVARYDATGQMLDQGIWVGDVTPAGDGLDSVHLAIALPMIPASVQPPGGQVAYGVVTPLIRWAPDARRITYSGSRDPAGMDTRTTIVVADLGPGGTTAPGSERRVILNASSQYDPVFSPVPGDDRIAFVQTTSAKGCTRNDLFVTTSAGGAVRQVTTSKSATVCQLGRPDWSPDGRWLTFDGAPQSLTGNAIWTIAADGSGKAVAIVLTARVTYYTPKWRP